MAKQARRRSLKDNRMAVVASDTSPKKTHALSGEQAYSIKAVSNAATGTRTLISGKLSRCRPLFSHTSEVVFCACSSTVLALSVETGEELFRLAGHTNYITDMMLLPPGLYGGAQTTGGSEGDVDRRLLTSSMDGSLRLWDVCADCISLEEDRDRCLRVLSVGATIFRMFPGRIKQNGEAADVILVTKEGASPLHGLASEGGDQKRIGDGTADGDGIVDDGSDVSELEDELDYEESDGHESDADERRDGDSSMSAKRTLVKRGTTNERGDSKPGDRRKYPRKKIGTTDNYHGIRKRLYKGGNIALNNWQAIRYELDAGKTQRILFTIQQQQRFIGAVTHQCPVRDPQQEGRKGKFSSIPILLVARGRVVTAVDAGSGDSCACVTTNGPVTAMTMGSAGEQLITGHLSGSMTQWHGLRERLGAAFGVAGFEHSGKQPSSNLHWHCQPVFSLGMAPDGVQLLSGGEEAVLVRWNLAKGTQAFLPRLGASIMGLAVSPGQQHAILVSDDNAASLVGLAGWEVVWQLRGMTLSHPSAERKGRRINAQISVKLTVEPKRGLLVGNGRSGHLQFYNVATDCVEASAEIVPFNRTLVPRLRRAREKRSTLKMAVTAAPIVEHVAFSSDGQRMVTVTSRVRQAGSRPSPTATFWNHALGSDPHGGGYAGSYSGVKGPRGRRHGNDVGSMIKGGTSGHWRQGTIVDDPHGFGVPVRDLKYHPSRDVAVTAARDGSFNVWIVKRSMSDLPSLAVVAAKGEAHEQGEGEESTYWACSMSVRYKAGLVPSALSFSSDGSVLAVFYHTKPKQASSITPEQDIIAFWSLESVTLLSTLLPTRVRGLRYSASPPRCLGFISDTGKILASGRGYAAVWDLVAAEAVPVWEYRANIRASACVDSATVLRTGKGGVHVPERGTGDVAICLCAASLGRDAKQDSTVKSSSPNRSRRGSVVVLLNASGATPLYTWHLPQDNPSSLQFLVQSGSAARNDGILCLTRSGDLLLLRVGIEAVGRNGCDIGSRREPQMSVGFGVVRMRNGNTAPGLRFAGSGKRQLLGVDLTSDDPSFPQRKRSKGSLNWADLMDDEENNIGHAGGREAGLLARKDASDILDPSTLNLAPVSDLYGAFMETLLKPAPKQNSQNTPQDMGYATSKALSIARKAGGWVGTGGADGRQKRNQDPPGNETPPVLINEGLVAVLSAKLSGEGKG